MKKRIVSSSLVSALLFFTSPLFLPPSFFSFAITSNCVFTDIGNPSSKAAVPSGACAESSGDAKNSASAGNGGGKWPLETKDSSQYKRIDEGWDLQSAQPSKVLAIAPGTVYQANSDPAGFGPDYPYEKLDAPILGHNNLYYGHVHIDPSVKGKHVNTGDVIANTDPTGATAGGLTNWLEVGFGDNVPDAKPHYAGGESETPEGQQMKQWLLGQDDSNSTNTGTNTGGNTDTNTTTNKSL